MTPVAQPEAARNRTMKVVIALVILVLIIGAISIVPKSALSNLAKNNIFALVGSLNGTTGQMLQHTKSLAVNVDHVKGQLSQLETQQKIIQEQTATGQKLQQELTTQKQLTVDGVNLMEQILSGETSLSKVTSTVADQTGQLTGVVRDNAVVLGNLLGALNTSNKESNELSGQLDQLLAQLGDSKQEFKFFGQVDTLLHGLLGKSTSSSGSTIPSLGGLLGGSTTSSSNSASASGSTQSGTSSSSNPLQSLLNGLL